MQQYIFGYGSLTNPKSREKTLPGERNVMPALLLGYQRKINALVDGHLYLNIIPAKGNVEGILIPVTEQELEVLKRRERGYERFDVTANLKDKIEGIVYAFIAPNLTYPSLLIPKSYIATCTRGMDDGQRAEWLKNTVIDNKIVEDEDAPVYEFSA